MRCTFEDLFMKRTFFTLFCLSSFGLTAQVELYLESRLPGEFELVVDAYHQGKSQSGKIRLQALDLDTHQLILQGEQEAYYYHQRMLQPPKAGSYYYLLERNFQGQVVLRYRGANPPQPASFPKRSFKTDQLAALPAAQAKPRPSAASIAVLEEPEVTAKALDAQSSVWEEVPPPPQNTDSTLVLNLKQSGDSARAVPAGSKPLAADTATEEKRIRTTFSGQLAEVKALAFEFEKLQWMQAHLNPNKLSITQWRSLLKALKYDQSRLQLLQWAFAQAPSLKAQKEAFYPSLEYDISRQQLSTLP